MKRIFMLLTGCLLALSLHVGLATKRVSVNVAHKATPSAEKKAEQYMFVLQAKRGKIVVDKQGAASSSTL